MDRPTPSSIESPGTRTGSMTRVFRAARAARPRVLRLGVVRGGRIVEERLVPRGTAVTIGRDESSTVVVTAAQAPRRHVLFAPGPKGYALSVTTGMDGRVVVGGELLVLSAPAGTEGASRIELSPDARGRVRLGETSLLFQFVEPPPVTPRAALPLGVLRGGNGIDFRTTLIAAFSFLAHFFVIGSAYSDLLDEVVDDDLRSLSVLDALPNLPAPAVEVPDETPAPAATAAAAPAVASRSSSHAPATSGNPAHAPSHSSDSQAALASALTTVMETVGALRAAGPATAGVLARGDVPTTSLDVAARSNTGVGFELSPLSGADRVRPGTSGTLASLGDVHGQATPGEGKGHAPESGPRGTVDATRIDNVGGRILDAARVVASLRGGFRACYNRALAQNPDVQGRISLSLRVGVGGRVEGVSATPSGNVPDALVQCVRARAQSAEFAPPEGGAAIVNVPVGFVRQ